MITVNGLNELTKTISGTFSKGEVGTGTSELDDNITALETPVGASLVALTSSDANSNLITTIYTLDTATANGDNVSEYGIFINDGTNDILLSRYRFSPIQKTDSIKLLIRAEFLVEKE